MSKVYLVMIDIGYYNAFKVALVASSEEKAKKYLSMLSKSDQYDAWIDDREIDEEVLK